MKNVLRTVTGAIALTLLLSGCAALPFGDPTSQVNTEEERPPSLRNSKPKEVPEIDIDSLTPIAVNLDPNVPTQPGTDTYGIAAAKELITIHINLVAQERYDEVCNVLYSPEYQRKATEIAVGYDTGMTCPEALKEAHEFAKTIDPLNDMMTPFYYVPDSYGISEELLEEDSDIMVYIPMITVSSLEETTFSDGPYETPGWMRLGGYAVKTFDGTWKFVTPPERTSIGKWKTESE